MDWLAPTELPDLRRLGIIALDTETRDDWLRAGMGSGWPFRAGHLCGVSVAYRAEHGVRGMYFPIRHPDSQNLDPEQVYQWVRDHIDAGVRFITQNGTYDWGWLRVEAGIRMPPGERIEEIGALATMVDENRFKYGLDALCAWRNIPGKDDRLLRQGIDDLGLHVDKRKKVVPQNYIWQLPARYVGTYAEADAVSTFRLREDLDSILDREGTRAAYRLECDLLPLVLEMRLRGIRVDLDAAERARTLLVSKRDAVFADLSAKLGCQVGMHEIARTAWLTKTFDGLGIEYPCTEKGNPSFAGGQTGWMSRHAHPVPRLIVKADKYNNAATKFLQNYILDHAVNGRVHAEIHPHRSEDNGTKSFRFSYSDSPLQQMTSRDAELAPLIRGVFLPEYGQVWAKPDASQQEFRLVVHYAHQHRLGKAADAVARYRDDPDADFHTLAATLTGLDRTAAKQVNFAKIYGAGVRKFAVMIGKPQAEAEQLYEQYDRELPFLRQLSEIYVRLARNQGYITLYDGARRHFDKFAPDGKWEKNAGPCGLDEARERTRNPEHPWYHSQLRRVDTHTALNALIQGSAARHTKLWMRACWREGIVPILQMHDCLDCSVSSREQAELVAQLGCEAVALDVPMRVDLKFGRSWGDAKHKWDELGDLGIGSGPHVEQVIAMPINPTPTQDLLDELLTKRARHSSEGHSRHGDTGSPHGERKAQFVYRHPDRPDPNYLLVEKWVSGNERKFFQYHRADGRWVQGVKGTYAEKKIPYRLPELRTALLTDANTEVHIAEGEKDADTLARLGFVSTTNPGGSKQWTDDLTAHLRVLGATRFVIHEDNDESGRDRTAKLAPMLSTFASCVRVARYPDVPNGEDVTWFCEHGTKEDLEARIAAAESYGDDDLDEWDAGDDAGVPDPRQWLMAGQFCRTFLSGLVAPGATGKTALRILQALALATGRELTGHHIYHRRRVLIVSFEDDKEELRRRILAARLHHGISAAELKGWLFLSSPKGLKLAEMRNGARVAGKLDASLRRSIARRNPDLLILDPFIKLHALEENDNGAMDFVADLLVQMAHEFNIAIDSPAHTRKGMVEAGNADVRRGASAAKDAGRLDYTLIPMSEDEAESFGIEVEDRKFYLRLDSAKVNLLPPGQKATWFRLVGVALGNATEEYPEGDFIQTVEPWAPPETWAELDAESINATLDEIEAGLPDGRRYSNDGHATDRAAWPILQTRFPGKSKEQCRDVIKTWIEKRFLTAKFYDDPTKREKRKGLFLNPARRPK